MMHYRKYSVIFPLPIFLFYYNSIVSRYVTTKYWYSNNAENIIHYMERLKLTEPLERQWVRDKTWSDHFECPNLKMYSSYHSFLDYLDMIRSMGKEHWKRLQLHEGNPNSLIQGCSLNELLPTMNGVSDSSRTIDDCLLSSDRFM